MPQLDVKVTDRCRRFSTQGREGTKVGKNSRRSVELLQGPVRPGLECQRWVLTRKENTK